MYLCSSSVHGVPFFLSTSPCLFFAAELNEILFGLVSHPRLVEVTRQFDSARVNLEHILYQRTVANGGIGKELLRLGSAKPPFGQNSEAVGDALNWFATELIPRPPFLCYTLHVMEFLFDEDMECHYTFHYACRPPVLCFLHELFSSPLCIFCSFFNQWSNSCSDTKIDLSNWNMVG